WVNRRELLLEGAEGRKFRVIGGVKVRPGKMDGIGVNDIGGVRVDTQDGGWLLRAPNTRAVRVARCESSTADGLERLKDQLRQQLVESGIEPPDLG
nr:phosphomannomutase [Alphaproteobacteria bacterium]